MPICKKCGLILAASDKVCRGCGTPVEATAQSAQPPQFPSSSMPESTPLPKPSGLTYSSPLSSAPPPIPSSPQSPTAPPPSPSFAAPPPIPSSPQSPAAPPPSPSFAAPPPIPSTPQSPATPPPIPTPTSNLTGTTQGMYTPPPPPSQTAAPAPQQPPASPVTEPSQPTTPPPAQQPVEEKPQEPQPIRPKAFKPGSGSKLPPNLDINNQPVSGVRKPYQQPQQQQQPMAQPINMAQVPPMANPPIKEQPIYQPFTPPSQQSPADNGSFSTGMVWAILVLIFCCNPIAIASIVLSAIAGNEFQKGDFANAMQHAKLSKIITLIAFILTILFAVGVSLMPTETTTEPDPSSVEIEIEQ